MCTYFIFGVESLEKAYGVSSVPLCIPMGANGVIDLVKMKAVYNDGAKGETIREEDIPAEHADVAAEGRQDVTVAQRFGLDDVPKHVDPESVDTAV